MATQKKKGINVKFFILIFVILFWAFLAFVILIMINILSGYRPHDEIQVVAIDEEDLLSCADVKIRFVSGGVCYDSVTSNVHISLISQGEATVSTLLVNSIGEDSMVMSENVINLQRGESETLKINYDLDENGFIRIVEIIPRFVLDGEEYRCESSKLISRNILLCD